MSDKTEVQIWIDLGADGDYTVASEREDAEVNYADNFNVFPVRVIKLTAFVAVPDVSEAQLDVEDDAGELVEFKAEAAEAAEADTDD